MAAAVMPQWFGQSNDTKPHDEASRTRKALPAEWYTSSNMFALERRAIFSKKWLLVTHQQRIPKVGDSVQTTVAGYPLWILNEGQDEITARYSVTNDPTDLLSAHVHVDKLGLIWINLDSAESPKSRWDDDHGNTDTQERLHFFDPTSYTFDHQYEITGDFNWKTLADNYNECYHCPTGHPALIPTSDFSKYYVKPNGSAIEHWNTDKEEGGQGLHIVTTFCYPSSHFTVSPAFFYIGRWIPISPSQTRMEYEVYKPNDPTLWPEFERLNGMFKVVLREDKELCEAAYRNVRAGIFSAGELHPLTEKGPRYFQQMTREIVTEQFEREKRAAREAQVAAGVPTPSI